MAFLKKVWQYLKASVRQALSWLFTWRWVIAGVVVLGLAIYSWAWLISAAYGVAGMVTSVARYFGIGLTEVLPVAGSAFVALAVLAHAWYKIQFNREGKISVSWVTIDGPSTLDAPLEERGLLEKHKATERDLYPHEIWRDNIWARWTMLYCSTQTSKERSLVPIPNYWQHVLIKPLKEIIEGLSAAGNARKAHAQKPYPVEYCAVVAREKMEKGADGYRPTEKIRIFIVPKKTLDCFDELHNAQPRFAKESYATLWASLQEAAALHKQKPLPTEVYYLPRDEVVITENLPYYVAAAIDAA